jgi:2-oxoisovalerate dehydrogenase E1 component beta subunit
MPETTYLEAIRQGMLEEMRRDPTVFLMGEDIGAYGGAFKVTEGLLDEFGPDRVIDTPLAEQAFVGAAIGASMLGMRPVVEFQFIDFMGCAWNLITNFAAKNRYRWGQGADRPPRPGGGGTHGGPFHSQNPEMPFVHTPGLKVVQPATAYDAKGLMKAAIRDEDPVIFFEHKYLYRLPRVRAELPEHDYVVPIGKAAVRREGTALTLITYGAMLHRVIEAATQLSQERPDRDRGGRPALAPAARRGGDPRAARKFGKVLVVHEDTRTGRIAGEIMALINRGRGRISTRRRSAHRTDTPVP